MRTLYLHGMESTGEDSTHNLCTKMKELDAPGEHLNVSYGHVSLSNAYSRLRYSTKQNSPSSLAMEIGYKLLQNSQDGDNLVAHSLGAIAAWAAMWQGRCFGTVFLFAAALDDDRLWPAQGAERIFNIHCRDDRILRIADNINLSDFGALGKHGYVGGHDTRITNIAAWPSTPITDDWIHSFYFHEPDCTQWAKRIIDVLNEKY